MFHDIQWVFESLSSKSLFYSFRAWFHQSIDSAKFVQLPLERSPALQSLPSTRAPTASAQIWLTLKLMTRHGSDRQVAAASSSRKGLHFQGVAQIPAAGTSPGDLLERHVVRCPPPTPAKSETWGWGPGICVFWSLPGDAGAVWNSLSSASLLPCVPVVYYQREKSEWALVCLLPEVQRGATIEKLMYTLIWSKKFKKNYKPHKIYKEHLKQ